MRYTGILLILLTALLVPIKADAAVGCDLTDPDRDVKRLFPSSTGFKTQYFAINTRGGDALLAKIEDRLGDKFSGLFETADVPYTLYEVYKEKQLIGYIHGVNQKGKYGGLQVFLALDTQGTIVNFYYQKLTSKEAKQLRTPAFGKQFAGLSLKEFYTYNIASGKASNAKVNAIKNPSAGADDDFRSTMRAVKKNLILMDEFIFANKNLKFR